MNMEKYVIKHNGEFLADRMGWGPVFTRHKKVAKKFNTLKSAEAYAKKYHLIPDLCDSIEEI